MGLFWNTIRYNAKNYTDDGKSVKNHFWTKGSVMAAVINTKCNFHCSYCPMFLTDNKYPKFKECSLDEWKEFFYKYPDWLSLIFVTGGEPSLLEWIGDLVNFLTERNHHVCLFSNMHKPENLIKIEKSFKFVLIPTFHPEYEDKKVFEEKVNYLKRFFRVAPQEMEEKKEMPFTKFKQKFRNEWWYNENFLPHANPETPRNKLMSFGCHYAYMIGKDERLNRQKSLIIKAVK